MKLLLENWREYLNEQILMEAETGSELEKEMADALEAAAQQLTTIEPEESEELDEAAIVVGAGLALALPQILEIIGKVINWAGAKVKKIIGKSGETDETKIGNTIIHFSHVLHKIYLKPIAFSVKAISKKFELNLSSDQIMKISDLIFHTIVAGFLVYSGVSALKAVATGSLKLATLEGAMAAVKSQELREFITEMIEGIAAAGAA